jgi:glyoxylase-like metal-dependent hydrolase (beta-lactamase superfamily II)
MKRVLLGIGGVLLLAVVVFYFTLVAAKYGPEACTYDLDLGRLRALAGSMPGDKPREIRVEGVTGGSFPKAIACPGQSWDKVQFRVYAYQVVFADKTIIVDTAMNLAQAKELGMIEDFDKAAWERVAKGLAEASAIYVTHEHADHMGGAVTDDKWASNLRLTPLQLDSQVRNRPTISPAARAAAKTIAYDQYQAVAPGVVLIEAAGHTPGSQMVFVTRADGTEVLFTGDTAWLMDNIEHEQGPAKIATMMMRGDPNRNACQLAALDKIRKTDRKVAIMPGHDKTIMQSLSEKGVFIAGFK